jgi:hypothetical protein
MRLLAQPCGVLELEHHLSFWMRSGLSIHTVDKDAVLKKSACFMQLCYYASRSSVIIFSENNRLLTETLFSENNRLLTENNRLLTQPPRVLELEHHLRISGGCRGASLRTPPLPETLL